MPPMLDFLNSRPALRFPMTMTTCKRFDLFERTVKSFFKHVDTWCIDRVYLIDDGSSKDDVERMRQLLDEFIEDQYEIIQKDPREKGHPQSINLIRRMMTSSACAGDNGYFIHMEDDFEFFVNYPLIARCAEVLFQFPQYGQCLFSNSYKEERRDFATMPWGAPRQTESGAVFYEHVWKDGANPHGYWPGFSLRPGLNRIEMFREMGDVIEHGSFEKDYATRCAAAGWKTAYMETSCCEHIGRKTSEKHDPTKHNAYVLNNSLQFDNFGYKQIQLSRTKDNALPANGLLDRLFLRDARDLPRANVLAAIAHVKLWLELTDVFKTTQAFLVRRRAEEIEPTLWLEPYYALNGFDAWDLLLLPSDVRVSRLERLDKAADARSLFDAANTAYLIHYTGAQKLLGFIEENGIGENIGAAIEAAVPRLAIFRAV